MVGVSLAIVGGIAAPLGAYALHVGRGALTATTELRESEEQNTYA
jgi:hypothetical protein